MQTTMGKTVQQLRRAKSMTQEQLARQLGVSSAAVSKWETGGALPDVALLCPLARALGCTANDLLDFRPQLTADEIAALCKTPRAMFEAGEWEQGLRFCAARLQEYPSDLPLAFQIGFLYAAYAGKAPQKALARQLRSQAIWLFQRAAELPDEEHRRTAWQMLARLYTQQKQYAQALDALGRLPSCNQEGLGLRAEILRQMGQLDEAAQLDETNLTAQLAALRHTMQSLAETRRRQGDEQAARRLEQQALALEELFARAAKGGENKRAAGI